MEREILCDFCHEPARSMMNVKIVGLPIWRDVLVHTRRPGDGMIRINGEFDPGDCFVKARRGYPKGHRDPVTDVERKLWTGKARWPFTDRNARHYAHQKEVV